MDRECICEWCDDEFDSRGDADRFCSRECYVEYMQQHGMYSFWGQRLEDGMRMLSDDFGQNNADPFN